jgi:hypothetical protein
MPDPTPAPTPAPGAPATPAPAPTPPADPAPTDPAADDGPVFSNERDRRRWSELTGRITRRERERDDARARLDHVLTRNAERIAASSLSEPADMWLTGATVDDLLTEDGSDVDAEKVKAHIDALVARRPGLRKPPEPRPLSGVHGVPGQIPQQPTTLADAMRRIADGRGRP